MNESGLGFVLDNHIDLDGNITFEPIWLLSDSACSLRKMIVSFGDLLNHYKMFWKPSSLISSRNWAVLATPEIANTLAIIF